MPPPNIYDSAPRGRKEALVIHANPQLDAYRQPVAEATQGNPRAAANRVSDLVEANR
jgi:hypothetical protein